MWGFEEGRRPGVGVWWILMGFEEGRRPGGVIWLYKFLLIVQFILEVSFPKGIRYSRSLFSEGC